MAGPHQAGPPPHPAGPPLAAAAGEAPSRPAGGPPAPPALPGPDEPAVIGDRLRIPVARCEAGGCRSQHEDESALGEGDVRARAIAAGWREDVLGRLACPACQSKQGLFWVPAPPGVPVARPSAPAPPVPDVAAGARRSGPRA
ncbi:MAG: hypothetical protein LBI49_05565, partial [Nocardiopsaceae bacterium]|nr:hypothetical protein [Nocardiopsaceae bacterium]